MICQRRSYRSIRSIDRQNLLASSNRIARLYDYHTVLVSHTIAQAKPTRKKRESDANSSNQSFVLKPVSLSQGREKSTVGQYLVSVIQSMSPRRLSALPYSQVLRCYAKSGLGEFPASPTFLLSCSHLCIPAFSNIPKE